MKKFLFALVLLQLTSVGHAVKMERDMSEDDGSIGTFKYEAEEDLQEGTERQEEQDYGQRRVNKRSLQEDIEISEDEEDKKEGSID